MLLNFRVPEKKRFASYSAEDGWVCKLNTKGKCIEIRRIFQRGTSLLIVVGLDGWEFKDEQPRDAKYNHLHTAGFNVRLSMNGPAFLTFDNLEEINQIVQEAKNHLQNL